MFTILGLIGDHMSGWADIDDDTDDILLATVKAKRARRRLKKLAEQKPSTQPRRLLLLLPLVALTLASCVDGLVFLFSLTIPTETIHPKEEVWSTLVGLCCYAYFSIKYSLASDDVTSKSMLLKIVCGSALVFNAIGLACNVTVPVMSESQTCLKRTLQLKDSTT